MLVIGLLLTGAEFVRHRKTAASPGNEQPTIGWGCTGNAARFFGYSFVGAESVSPMVMLSMLVGRFSPVKTSHE